MKAKSNEIEAVKRTLSQADKTHADRMKDKDEELDSARKQCEKLEKDIENAKNAARQELLQERQLLEAKVMRVLMSCNNV